MMREHTSSSAALLLALCAISVVARADDDAQSNAPTFTRDVLPILQRHCQECHRPGQVGPMSLLTYAETRPWAKAIRDAVTARAMPPFHANAPLGTFQNDQRLTEDEIAAVTRWVDTAAPQGDPDAAPHPVEWPSAEWTRGEPDLVLEFPEYQAPAETTDQQVLFFSDKVFDNQTWVKAFELRATDYRAVHHVGVFVFEKDIEVPKGRVRKIPDEEMGGFIFEHRNLYTWLPGQRAETLPEGSAFVIRRGERVVLQTHMPPLTESSPVKLSLGIWLYTGTLNISNEDITAFNYDLAIPAGEPNYVARKTITFGHDATITGYNVHMHLRGKSSQILFHYPDGTSEVAFDLPRYSFDWQRRYWLAEPKPVPAGTQMEFVGVWDNSADNPLNPDPTIPVEWGRRTVDEMYTGMVYFSRPRVNVREIVNGIVTEPGD
jgi:mono/diheme cytochrome c family protein